MNFLMMVRKQLIISKALRMGLTIGAIMILPHLSWFLDPFVAAKVENFFDLNTLQTIGLILTSAIAKIQEKEEHNTLENKDDSRVHGRKLSIQDEHDIKEEEPNAELQKELQFNSKKCLQRNSKKKRELERFDIYGVEIDDETHHQMLLKQKNVILAPRESEEMENFDLKYEPEEPIFLEEKKTIKMKKKERKNKERHCIEVNGYEHEDKHEDDENEQGIDNDNEQKIDNDEEQEIDY